MAYLLLYEEERVPEKEPQKGLDGASADSAAVAEAGATPMES